MLYVFSYKTAIRLLPAGLLIKALCNINFRNIS